MPGNGANTVSTMQWTGPSWPKFNGMKSLLTEKKLNHEKQPQKKEKKEVKIKRRVDLGFSVAIKD